ncbi:hypothetical protein CLOM_g10907 [Closterium sp. NIES-68]|nr:hypothetical protein CLOM_g10907 [Closterium sp. NIES-68]GJP57770.1 hypothetical protein CLOP_g17365 [Closterium sp. NIES-67]
MAGDPQRRATSSCREAPSAAAAAAASAAQPSDPDLAQSLLSGRKLTAVAHQLWSSVVRRGDTVVDATCGNGHDALAMAALALSLAPTAGDAESAREEVRGRVVAMDIQEEAVRRTNQRLAAGLSEQQMARVHTICGCHSTLLHHVAPDSARLVAFNLGYLPHADRHPSVATPSPPTALPVLTTRPSSTVAALAAAVTATAVGGVISVMAYVGHTGGREEYDAVLNVAASLPTDSWVCWEHRSINRPLSPRLVVMRRTQ